MAEGEQSPRPNSLKPQEVQQLGDEAVEKMRRRVESRLALDIPQEPTLPMSVAGEDVHARTGSPQVPELSEPVSQGDQSGQILGGRRRARKGVKNVPQASEPVVATAVPVDGPNDEAPGTKWWLKEIAAEGQLAPDPKVEAKVEPVAAVAADNPDEAAKIERLVKEAAAVEATIAQESLGDPIVADAQAPGEVAPRRRAVNVAEASKSASAPLPVPEATIEPKVQHRDREVSQAPVSPDTPAAPTLAVEAEKAAADTNGEQYEFRVLKNGEEQQYLAADSTLFIVRKKKDGYYFVDGDGELSGPVTQDVMRYQAEAEGWRMIEVAPAVPEEKQEAVPVVEVAPVAEVAPAIPEASVSLEVPKIETPADSLQQKIDALKIEVAEFRYKYAEMDYEKTSAWKTLKGFFRNITPGQEDADTQYWNSEYMSKLMALQNLELEQVKQEGLKGEALKERMAGVIQYYKYEQATALYNDRTQVRMDRQNFIGKAWGKWEQAVKAYGTLSLSKKVLIGVGLAGLSVATGGVGAAGILILRRMMGATGVAMATDAALAAFLDKKEQEKQAEDLKKEVNQMIDPAFVSSPEERLSGLINEAIGDLNQKLQKKKRNALYRKGISLGIGVGLVLGGSVLASQASGMMHHESAATSTESASAPAAASAPEQASSAPARTEVPAATQETPSASQADVQGFKVEFERYQVTDADGKRGLWGILEQHLPEDMLPQAEKNRIIQSLENAIQQKLDHMSPAELKAVGFPTGNINTIYAGTQIDLGKLLTPDEVQAVMEGKNVTLSHVEAPSHVGGERLASSPVPDTAPSAAPQEAVSGQATASQPSSVKPAPVLDTYRSETLVQKNIPVTDPLTYLREHPEALGRYNSTLGRLRMGIFMMNPGEAGVPMEYDYTLNGEKLGSTQISQVLKDLKGFDRGFLQNLDYDRVKNPLHYDQMRELGKFIEASGKAFGPKLASVEAGESIDRYTRRMAMVALQTGKEIKGFYKP